MRERPSADLEETGNRQDRTSAEHRGGKKQKVHSLIDKVYSRTNLD
jgi:hypothetical protein